MWIETVLERKLDRVAAPEELWDRIDTRSLTVAAQKEASRLPSRGRKGAVLAWTCVTAMLVVVLVWGFRPRRDLVFRSESATQIRAWVKANAGFDVPLLGSRQVSLAGARLVRGDVEIACRVGDHQAKLLVSKGNSSVRHGGQFIKERSTVAWGMSGRLYTLACATPEDLRIACMLCHSSSEPRIALN
jgi:hypothetical protein